MPPPKIAARNDNADTRIQAVFDFASKLVGILNDRSIVPNALRRELEAHTRQVPALPNAGFAAHARTFDAHGTALWNAAAHLLDNRQSQPDPRIKPSDVVRLGLRIRVFALILLNNAHATSSRRAEDRTQRIRVMKVAIRATKSCLDGNDLEHAHTCLEVCSQYAQDDGPESLIQLAPVSPESSNEYAGISKMLTTEYYLLRLLHAWKSDRMDLAEHFYTKICIPDRTLDAELATKGADTLFEVAKSLTTEREPELAVKWYDRAFTLLSSCEMESLGQDATELLLSIGIALVDRLLVNNLPVTRSRASEVIRRLEKTHSISNRISVLLVRFKLLASEQRPDAEQILQILLQLIRLVIVTDDSFKLVMQTIKKAVNVSLDSALAVLKGFICTRIIPEIRSSTSSADSKTQIWLEQATISYILFVTTGTVGSCDALLPDLNDLLDSIQNGCGVKFTTKATHASQTLLWKASGSVEREAAYAWIRLLTHPVFEHAGSLNKARICRRLMRTAIEEGNAVVAHNAFVELPVAAQNEPLTRYLAFKLALHRHDDDLAMSSLKVVMKAASRDPTCLYACVLEAQQPESRSIAVAALQAILDERPVGIHLPSLLRCIARLLTAELNSECCKGDEALLELLKIFETAAKCIDDIGQASGIQWHSEVQWWSKNTYNLAIRLSAAVQPELLIRLLDVCIIFLERYPNDTALRRQERVEHRKLVCVFLATTSLIVLGRSGSTEEEYNIQCFLHAQQRIDTFKVLWEKSEKGSADEQDNARAFAMLKFELECILRLERWECLGDALVACLDAQGVDRWDALADLLIIVHRQLDSVTKGYHFETITQLLHRIINDTWGKNQDIAKVARWLRFTFTLCLGHDQGDFSLKLLGQAARMAEKGQKGSKHGPYPEAELQWLATTGFNHAIDLLINEEGDAALSWMNGALSLARWSNDNGALHASFTSKKQIALERVKGYVPGTE